jgi:hypothetical protein
MFKPFDKVRVTYTAIVGVVTTVNGAGWYTIRVDDRPETWPEHRLQRLSPWPAPVPVASAVSH